MHFYSRQGNVKTKSGFTLVELLVAVSIFSMVMLIVVSALLTMVEANRKGQAIASVMNNLNFALESMTRMARTGTDYRCGPTWPISSSPADCVPNGDDHFRFTASDGRIIYFRFNANTLERCIDLTPGTTCGEVPSKWIPMVGSEVNISSASKFYVYGSAPFGTDNIQPRVIFTVRGDATVSGENTRFDIQSSVVQRTPDR